MPSACCQFLISCGELSDVNKEVGDYPQPRPRIGVSVEGCESGEDHSDDIPARVFGGSQAAEVLGHSRKKTRTHTHTGLTHTQTGKICKPAYPPVRAKWRQRAAEKKADEEEEEDRGEMQTRR